MSEPFNLKFFTGGEGNASLKRKVFCAYHPKDARLVPEVFRDLSAVCGCTLFYYEPGQEPEQLESDLGSMNLFVLAVTTDFLLETCFANERAYAFAVDHGIPVLPILFESGLEEVFNHKIGNLQCLSKVLEKIDSTTVPYREKLSNYLSQVLSAETDMKRCAAAFDTSIFLSYRKKDRKYAQKLMDLIHEEESCRNIAIWYDEFLVPGEDFNDSIKTELEDSSMFVLVVTPHIVEGDNYITTTEYPMATSLQKPVLPFELLSTDLEKLRVFCPGIDDPVGTDSGAKVRATILEALKKLGVSRSENTAERSYLMGLAYLKGICVEKNSAVGFAMIKEAAEAGVREAAKTLVFLYRNAEGTAQDLGKAIRWQEHLLELSKADYERDPGEIHARAVINAGLDLAQIQTQSQHNEDTHKTYYDVVRFCETDALADQIYAKEYAALAYELSGKLWLKEGNYLEAQVGCFEEAQALREELLDLAPSLRALLELIDLCESMAEVCEEIGQILGVKDKVARIKRLMAQVEDVEATAENYDLIKRIMQCNNRLAHLYNSIDLWDASRDYVRKGKALAEQLTQISDTRDAKRQLMLAYEYEGESNARCNVENRSEEALVAYQTALEMAEVLRAEQDTLEIRLDMARLHKKIGEMMTRIRSDEAAVSHFETALTHFRTLESLAGTLPLKRYLYRCCFSAAKGYQNLGEDDKALALLTESEQKNLEVLTGFQFRSMRTDLAYTLAAVGEIYKGQWDTDKALEYFQRSHALVKRVFHERQMLFSMRPYAMILKKYISAAKLAGEFDLVDELKAEYQGLEDQYREFFG